MRLIFVLLAALAVLPLCAAQRPEFDKAHEEAVAILRDFVRIQTPNSNETQGAKFLKSFLDAEGIPSEILEMERGRGSLVARIKGNGKKRPLLLLGHIDTVGVEREKWTVEPYEGVIRDGFLYGRGARDDKGMSIVNLAVFLQLARLKVPLDRDVIYVAEAGEEGASYLGIDFLVEKHWDKIECEYALNEGGGFYEEDGKVKTLRVATAEKVPRPLMLTAKGTSGHGSRPRADNPIVHLAMAIAKFDKWQPPMRLNDTTREYFSRVAAISSPEKTALYRSLEKPQTQEKLRLEDIGANAMLRTTVSPNIIKGGFTFNVIPGDATANLDVRALPDEDMSQFVETLTKLIDDPAVTVTPLGGKRPATAPSRLDNEMFRALEAMQKKHFPGAITVPYMSPGATDSAQLRAKGVQAYGIGPVGTEADGLLIHGNDERISVPGLKLFLQFLWDVTIEIAGAK